ncbi:MAG: hypothetical protein IPK60_21530 [Sandaracinaceae bacterium]|nr:hypothetical protein [Sandaracinaceae bacterium]
MTRSEDLRYGPSMGPERKEFPLRPRTPQAVGGVVLFGVGALYFYAVRGVGANGTVYLVCAALSLGMAVAALVAVFNLMTHEGFAIVLTHDAIELPRAPYRSRRRERIPLAAIEAVSFSPEPPAAPDMVILHVLPGPTLRWIRQDALESDTAADVARLLIERVTALRGPGRGVDIRYH